MNNKTSKTISEKDLVFNYEISEIGLYYGLGSGVQGYRSNLGFAFKIQPFQNRKNLLFYKHADA